MTAETSTLTVRKPIGDSDTEPVTVSVIISSYNAREVLRDCLQSIYQNPPAEPYEIMASTSVS